ncbi:hypothetical protein BBTM_00550 [Bifidobacterium bifidum]|nr:hypothetical protein BBTM_00550 [Bifidobacterium bifidum]
MGSPSWEQSSGKDIWVMKSRRPMKWPASSQARWILTAQILDAYDDAGRW